jgi:hypothetical protein
MAVELSQLTESHQPNVKKARKADRYPHDSTHIGAVVSFESVGGGLGVETCIVSLKLT